MGIKKRLTALLNARNMNVNELGQRIDVTPSTLYSIMQRDSSRIDIDLIIKISHALGVTADELLSEEIEAAANEKPIDQVKAQLDIFYDSFNPEGREKLLAYARDLDASGIYKLSSRNKDVG